jgi:hypothetical protein
MPNQPKKMMMKPYKKMGVITDKERKMLEKIDYAGDFDRELAKFEDVVVPKSKGMDKTGYGPNAVRTKSNRRQQARDMMRTSKPEVRETKQDMIRRKKKDLGIVGQLTESELKTMKRSMSANERKMLSSK